MQVAHQLVDECNQHDWQWVRHLTQLRTSGCGEITQRLCMLYASMFLALLPLLAVAQSPQPGPFPGKIAADVRCAKVVSQGYALYLPSNYSPDRAWPLLLAFDPRARGLTAVERFAPAAERYGWIIAGSNNSRNGSGQSSVQSLQAMSDDIFAHYPVESKRIYAGGMSGGARVAMGFAMTTGSFAGVIAASAGFPDSRTPKSVPFPIFGTAGNEDFNWSEMSELDQTLTSPHRVVVFEGGHVWLSSDIATEAVEWLELHAMRTGIRAKDPALIARLFADRTQKAEKLQGKLAWEAIRNIGLDFDGLHEQAASFKDRAKQMAKEKAVQTEIKHDRQELAKEQSATRDIWRNEQALANPQSHDTSLASLRDQLTLLTRQAESASDSVDRRIARRVTRGVISRGNRDLEYQKLLDKLRLSKTTAALKLVAS